MDTVKSYYIFCSSTYRSTSDTTTNYTLQISERIEVPQSSQYFRITLENFSCLQEIPSVTSANNTIEFNGIFYYLPVGNYRVTDLLTWFGNTLSAITVSYDPIGNAFTFNGAGVLRLIGNTAALFGFPNDQAMSYYPVTSSQPVRLRSVNHLVLSLNNLPTSAINLSCLTSACAPSNILAVVPIETFPSGLLQFANNNSSFSLEVRNAPLFELAFAVTDIYGNAIVSMPDHQFTLRIDVIEPSSREVEAKLDRILEQLRLLFLMKSLKRENNIYWQTVTEDAQEFLD